MKRIFEKGYIGSCQIKNHVVMTAMTPETLKETGVEAVFLGAGSTPVRPALEGLDGKNVLLAEEVIAKNMKPDGKTVIVGAGLTGLETAVMLHPSRLLIWFHRSVQQCILPS